MASRIPIRSAAISTTSARPSTSHSRSPCCTPCRALAAGSRTSNNRRPEDTVPQGLPRKNRVAFLLQVVLVSLAVVIAGWLVSMVIRVGFIRSASEAEAADYFARKTLDSTYSLPHGRNFKSWFVRDGYRPVGLPAGIAS